MELFFLVAFFGSVYSYFVYPLVLLLLPIRRPGVPKGPLQHEPKVAVIVPSHNEEVALAGKLENVLDLDYPRDKLEVVVTSDASTDRTDAIARDFEEKGVRLVCSRRRRGKEHAQGLAIAETTASIIIFTDVGTRMPKDAARRIVELFQDGDVGAVSSEDRFETRDGKVVGEGAYVRYEMWLRRLESRVNSLVGLSGSLFAARREVCEEWDASVPSDFNTAINCVKRGYIAISDEKVLGYYRDIADNRAEYKRKLRTVIRGIAGVMHNRDVLNPFRYGLFAFQVWSHKIMRWAVPWFLLALLAISGALATHHWVFSVVLGLQIAFYGAAAAGALWNGLNQPSFIRVPFFFVLANVAIAHAVLAFLSGARMLQWAPSKR